MHIDAMRLLVRCRRVSRRRPAVIRRVALLLYAENINRKLFIVLSKLPGILIQFDQGFCIIGDHALEAAFHLHAFDYKYV